MRCMNYVHCDTIHLCKTLTFMQVEKLRKDLEKQKKEKETLEARANEAEKKIKELSSTIENVCILICLWFGEKIVVWIDFIADIVYLWLCIFAFSYTSLLDMHCHLLLAYGFSKSMTSSLSLSS